MYAVGNPKTKKSFRELVATDPTAKHRIERVAVHDVIPQNGTVYVEGPKYPAPHTWYAEVTVVGGVIVRIK